MRTFAKSDCIVLEVFHSSEEELPDLDLYDGKTGNRVGTLAMKEYKVNQETRMGYMEKSGFSEGHYYLRMGEYESECVQIVPDDRIDGTVLLQYSNRDNRQRADVITRLFGDIRYFTLRIPGGFKDSGWAFSVDNEQFLDQEYDPIELSSLDYTDKALTIGTSSGVDPMTAELVNRVLTCPLVYVDGTRYARREGGGVETVAEYDNGRCVYSVMLREAHVVDAEIEIKARLNLRRTPQKLRRAGLRPRRYR